MPSPSHPGGMRKTYGFSPFGRSGFESTKPPVGGMPPPYEVLPESGRRAKACLRRRIPTGMRKDQISECGDTMQDPGYPQRKSPRIRNYDYKTPGYYFVTICTHQKRCIFGGPERLGALGIIAEEGITQIQTHFRDVRVDKYVVMPNHVHMIIVLEEGASSLSTVVGSYKSYVTGRIRKGSNNGPIWQTSFHDHVIRDEKGYLRIWNYIDGNPSKWEEDCFYSKA